MSAQTTMLENAALTAPACDTTQPVPRPAPPPADLKACLVQIHPAGPGLGSLHVLGGTPVIIGRDNDCEISIKDSSVSRRHACVQPHCDGYYAIDLQSTNGTLVDDEPAGAVLLRDGCHLRIGNLIFRFLAGQNVEFQYHEEIYRLTILDGLTGIHNQRYLMECLERELGRCRRYGRPLSLMLFDIDRFKAINDRLGHLGGDAALRDLVARVQGLLRKEDLFARYGGEEFAVIAPETSRADALKMAERLRSGVGDAPFHYEEHPYPITISLGVVEALEHDLSPADWIRRADEMLYRAKQDGRNCVRG